MCEGVLEQNTTSLNGRGLCLEDNCIYKLGMGGNYHLTSPHQVEPQRITQTLCVKYVLY